MNSNLIRLFVLLATVAVCQASMAEYLNNLEFVPLKSGKAPTPPIFPNQFSSAFAITYFLPGSLSGLYGYVNTDFTANKQSFNAGYSEGAISMIVSYNPVTSQATSYALSATAGQLTCSTSRLTAPIPNPNGLQNSTFIGAINLPRHGLCYGWKFTIAGILDAILFTRATGTQLWAPALFLTNLYAVEYSATVSVPLNPSVFDVYSICPANPPSISHAPRSAHSNEVAEALANTFFF